MSTGGHVGAGSGDTRLKGCDGGKKEHKGGCGGLT